LTHCPLDKLAVARNTSPSRVKKFRLLFFVLALLPLRADLLVQPHDRVLVATEGRLDPGMVSVDIAAYFLMCQPVENLTVICAPGDGVEQFMRRFPTQLAPWKPTVALISHGVGDGRAGKEDRGFTYYHPTYLAQTLDALKKAGLRTIIVGSVPAVDSTLMANAKVYNDTLAALRDQDRETATKAGLPFVDLFGPMLDTMTKAKAALGESYVFEPNGADIKRNGALVETWAFLKTLGCDGNIGTITVDMGAKSATGTPGQEVVSDQDGVVTVKSTRYPFCFTTNPNEKLPAATYPISTVFPFNDDLNRYLLVVKGVKGKAKVTWGETTKEYTADELAKGVNLAAEFTDNPFSKQFAAVNDAVRAQQEQETAIYQQLRTLLPGMKKTAPGIDSVWDQILPAAMAEHDRLYKAAQDLVIPVTHTIKIEPEA